MSTLLEYKLQEIISANRIVAKRLKEEIIEHGPISELSERYILEHVYTWLERSGHLESLLKKVKKDVNSVL